MVSWKLARHSFPVGMSRQWLNLPFWVNLTHENAQNLSNLRDHLEKKLLSMATRPNAETLTQNTTKYKNSAKSTDDKRNSFQGTQKSDARGLDMLVFAMVCDSWSYWSRLSGSVGGKRAEALFVCGTNVWAKHITIVPWKQFPLSSVLFAASLNLQFFKCCTRVVKLITVFFVFAFVLSQDRWNDTLFYICPDF